jgi:hypothetical protein
VQTGSRTARRTVSGDEYAATTTERYVLKWKSGERAAAKRSCRRRERHEARLASKSRQDVTGPE